MSKEVVIGSHCLVSISPHIPFIGCARHFIGFICSTLQIHSCGMYENEKPSLRHIVWVVVVTAMLIAMSWIAYYKFGLFR